MFCGPYTPTVCASVPSKKFYNQEIKNWMLDVYGHGTVNMKNYLVIQFPGVVVRCLTPHVFK